MIPLFPKFKSLELSDKKEIEKITQKYPPYSDFNFVSMWSWNLKDEMQISTLNENLVVRFNDYLTGEKFYSFLGDSKVDETAEKLIDFSKKEKLSSFLKLVPEETVKKLNSKKFKILEDRNHFDYIFGHKNLSSYEGHAFAKHRNLVRRFEKKHKYEIVTLDLVKEINKKMLFNLIEYWINMQKNKKDKDEEDHIQLNDLENEFTAFRKLLSASPDFLNTLICLSLFIDGTLSGFIVNEKISKDYSLAHFGKANTEYEGIYHFLMQKNSKIFIDLGINYLNLEQDLGLKNLRYSKTKYRPVHFLKKYTVALQD